MLRADVGVAEFPRFGHRELEHLLGPRRVGEFTERNRGLPLLHGLLDLFVNLVEIDIQVCEHGSSYSFALTDEAQEDVLGAHIVVLEADGFFPGHRQHFSDTVGKVVVHTMESLTPPWANQSVRSRHPGPPAPLSTRSFSRTPPGVRRTP